MQTVRQWLEKLGLPQYVQVFAENDVDLEALRFLTEGDLEKLGVSLGNRKKLLNAIAQLDGSRPAAATASDKSPRQESPRAEAQRRQLTVMFCDLVGSTELATKVDPEQLRDLMQAYQRTCGEVIAQYEGHVAQYLGDGLMVYFGWPAAHEDDAVRAIRAGLEAVDVVSKLSAPIPMSARVGIHTGLVVVGETGHGDASIPKAAVGETPNLAARLQALAEPGSVVASERTCSLARGLFDYADLGAHTLKGVSEPVHLFRMVRARVTESRFDAARSGTELTPLVGREEEVELLVRRWAQAKTGEGQVVLIGGEPGIGKSRLTQALRERIEGEAHIAQRFQCSPYHLNSALYPIIEQFERGAGFTREEGAERKLDKMQALLSKSEAQLADAEPLFAALLSLPTDRYPPLNLSPQKQKEKTLEVLAGRIEALAGRQPLLMVFEDAHWIDPTTQELLEEFLPRLPALPILLVITYRPEYTPAWVGQPNVTTLTLNRLGRRLGAELVAKLTGGKPLPQEVLDQILAHTDGIPLFIEELTKSVLESKLLREENDGYSLQAPLPALAIPTTLRDSLIARLDRLAPVREVAQIGACIGREFSYELIAAVSPLKDEHLGGALEQLTKTGLVFRRGTPPDALYTFKHALVQDAAYDSLLKSKRAQLHAQIADVLKKSFSDQVANEPQLLAHHYMWAGLTDQAIEYWRKAGELALQRVTLNEAIAHLNKGLELTHTLPASARRDRQELTLRTLLGTAWIALRGWAAPEAEVNFTPALRLAKSLEHRPSYLPVLHGLWEHDAAQGRVADSVKTADEVLRMAEVLEDPDLRIMGHMLALSSHFLLGHFQQAHRHDERIAPLYNAEQGRRIEHLTNHDPLTWHGAWGAPCLCLLGYYDQALRLLEAAQAHARQRGHPFALCQVLSIGSSWVFGLRGEPDQLLSCLEEAETVARAHGIPFFSDALVPTLRAIACVGAGRASEVVPQLRDAIVKLSGLGHHVSVPGWKATLAAGIAQTGDIEGGLRLIQEALTQIERPGWEERVHLAEILRLKGGMLQRQGKLDEAERDLWASVELARNQEAKPWELRTATTLARLLTARGEHSAARQLLSPIYDWFTEGLDTRDLKRAKALLNELS